MFHEQMQNTHSSAADFSRPDQTAALTRGVFKFFLELGMAPLAEFRLANGRRADVAALDRSGRLIIAEVKSCRADFEADTKWRDYLDYCDQFYFAVDTGFPPGLLPDNEGVILADAFGAAIHTHAEIRPMVAARRKAVMLRFARQSALRLSAGNLSAGHLSAGRLSAGQQMVD